jgi:hypothetical protein
MENDLKNTIDYLDEKTRRNSGFSVPTNYFSEFEEAVFTQISTTSFSKETGFKTPDGYFNSLEDKILQSISTSQKQSKVITFKRTILKIAPFIAAASIALFITFNSYFFKESNTFSLDSISQKDIENWLDSNSFSNTEIATVLGDDFLDLNDFSFTELKTENLENYLTTIDTNNLLDEIEK